MARKKTSSRTTSAASKKSGGEDAADANLERLEAVLRTARRFTRVSELEYEDKHVKIRVTMHNGAPAAAHTMVVPAAAPAPAVPAAPPPATKAASEPDHVHLVKSPFVGTYYSAPSPDADLFTEKGAKVTKGQTLCIVEAMKLMNEIESEVSGTVIEILAENGKAVQYGDALFKIDMS